MTWWEIWKGGGEYWLERPNGRHDVEGLQRCIARFEADAVTANVVLALLRAPL